MAASPHQVPRPKVPRPADVRRDAPASGRIGPTVPAELTLGSVVGGRYEIRRELGRGGAASVFAAEHTIVKRQVALKVPHPDPELREVLNARLRREIQALAQVRHPVIVDVHDAGESDGMPFLAMELIEGRPLSGLITARGKLEPDEVAKIGVCLAAGLAAVHSAGILHRDVKPANVIVAKNPWNQVRLFDFGVAKFQGTTEAHEPKLTQSGAILGTVEYMAPEALLSQPGNDHRADVYALGVTLYECLTGSVPFEGNLGQILVRLTTEEARPVTTARPDVPRALGDVVHRCLRRDPNERFSNMTELRAALQHCLGKKLDTVDVLGTERNRAMPPPLPKAPGIAAPPPQNTGAEARRVFPRAPYTALCTLAVDARTIDAKIEDVSEGGVLVVAEEQCAPGTTLRLKFALPISGRVIEVPSLVRWSRASRGLRATGLEFKGLGAAALAEIRQYVTLMGGS